MMATKKARPKVGDCRWRARWCVRLSFDSAGDVRPDNCDYAERLFPSRALARAFAEKVWPETKDKLGLVEVQAVEFKAYDDADARAFPYAGRWDAAGDPEIFSGEWE